MKRAGTLNSGSIKPEPAGANTMCFIVHYSLNVITKDLMTSKALLVRCNSCFLIIET
jgi:hypothetical protein